MGYLFSLGAVVSASMLGLSYKLCDMYKCDRRQVNLFFFITAALLSFVWFLAAPVVHSKAAVGAGLGAVIGLVVFVTIIVFREASARGPISVTFTVLNLSMVVPVAASIVFWHEIPSIKHCLGLLMTLVAIIMFGIDVARGHK